MQVFEIYTLGSGVYLEKVLNAIVMITTGAKDKNPLNFIAIMKFASIASIGILALRATFTSDLKEAIKWFASVAVLVSLFLTTKADVVIFDRMPDSYGKMQAARQVQNVPWGLAFIGSVTSTVGDAISQRFDMAMSAVFGNANSSYQDTGVLFGSKIIEDVSYLRILDANLTSFIAKFYKRCMVPDLNWGKNRENGYTLNELVNAEDILDFLTIYSSKARTISYDGILLSPKDSNASNAKADTYSISKEISCNDAAKLIKTRLEREMDKRMPILANSFLSYFDQENSKADKSVIFGNILQASYGIFLKKASTDAKNLLLQNVMINAISDLSIAKSFSKVATEEMTRAAQSAVSQMAQKFVVILRAVLECLFYGTFPLILILLVTPIGMEVLKNYAFGFVYLQLWQPMYAILFCMSAAWGKAHGSGIEALTFASQQKLAHINAEIASVAGYMLASIPILSIYITRGMISSMGNLANSIMYIPQTAAVGNAESMVKGNYQLGTTSVDNHSYNNTSSNKFDDNHSWMSGMTTLAMPSGASQIMFGDGRSGINSSGAISNTAGLMDIDWNQAYGSRLDMSINDNISQAQHFASRATESATAGYAKLLGFDQNYAQGTQVYEDWRKGLTLEQRASLDEARSYVDKYSESHGMSQQDALKLAVAANGNLGLGSTKGIIASAAIGLSGEGSTGATKQDSSNQSLDISHDKKFSDSLSNLENITTSNSYQDGTSINNAMLESARSDFAMARSASFESSRAFDRAHNLQESKSAHEQDSSSVSQKINNMATEVGIKQYGAAGFENMIRTKPHKTKEFANKFADEIIRRDAGGIKAEFAAQKTSLNDNKIDNLRDHYHSSQDSVLTSSESNDQRINQATPENFKSNVVDKMKGDIKKSIDNDLSKKNLEFNQSKDQINEDSNKLQDKVIAKNKQTATGALVDAWTKPKDNK